MNHPKSAVTAGLLGIFLGQFGAHNWYLGEKIKGIIHVCLFGVGLVLFIVATAIAASAAPRIAYSYFASPAATSAATGAAICYIIAILILLANGIWALVEAIILFARGDQGLAARGYAVANPNFAPAAPIQNGMNNSVSANPSNAPTNSDQAISSANTNLPNGATAAPSVAQRPPKQPMNPKTKKKIIIGVIVGVIVLIAAIVAVVVIAIASRVDYGESYRVAKELDDKIDEIYYDYDCSNVVSYVDSAWTSERNYNGYISSCKDALNGVSELVDKLGDTAGVKRNKEIGDKFSAFKSSFEEAFPNLSDISAQLDLYQVWHNYAVKVDSLSASSSDAEVKAAADILINSGNETLKNYATTWLEKTTAYIHAYKAYWDSSYSDPNRDALRKAMNTAQTEQRDWVSENRPDITSLVGLEFNDTAKVYNNFGNLYQTIREVYQENYDFDSGDCTYYEYIDTVDCR